MKNFMRTIRETGAVLVTIMTGGLAIWWLIVVALRLGQRPVLENGMILVDEFQRAKDILIIVMPLFTAAVAYWLGSAEASRARNQLLAVVDVAPPGTLDKAKQTHRDAFIS